MRERRFGDEELDEGSVVDVEAGTEERSMLCLLL